MTPVLIPLWAQIIICALLLISAFFTLLAALGIVRFEHFYQRMHPIAIVVTLGAWCVCIAAFIFFTCVQAKPTTQMVLIFITLAITLPISTVTLARTVLFRKRQAGKPVPPALSYTIVLGDLAPIPEKEVEKREETDI